MSGRHIIASFALLAAATGYAAGVVRTSANDDMLIMEDVPDIPASIVEDLNQYQNVRYASTLDWSVDGAKIYVNARFGDVNQIHRVDMPMGARRQLTFFNEPVSDVIRRPGQSDLLFMRDTDGSEFTQLLMLSADDGSTRLLTDGGSRNGSPVWDRSGQKLAFHSTRRNGASNDIWLMDPDTPESARLVLESPDGSWWGPQDFSASGSKILSSNFVSSVDSRIHLIDLDRDSHELLAGGAETKSANTPIGFDADDGGFWFISDQNGEFGQLAWQAARPGAEPRFVTDNIRWDISNAAISNDRLTIAFVANENGISRLYLMDTATREYRPVNNIPGGVIYGMRFSPDDKRLAMTISSARLPSDTFVLTLGGGEHPLEYGPLTRWTESEVGGLDASTFVTPQLVHYQTFDKVDGLYRQIPAWIYKPMNLNTANMNTMKPGPVPVIISIHGGPEGQSRPYFNSTYQMWVAKLGVAVIAPNVRGSTGYGKSYQSLDDGQQREDSVRDIGALLDWIEAHPDLDQNRVAVYGASYGGYMALASAVHYSDRLKAAVDVVGISNFVSFLENTQDYRRDLRRAEYGDERDPQMRRHLQDISPLSNVRQIRIPMFVVQGANDPRVPVTESEQMLKALRKQGLPVWYMNAMNEGHGYRKKENLDLYQQAMVLFFRQYLLGTEQEAM